VIYFQTKCPQKFQTADSVLAKCTVSLSCEEITHDWSEKELKTSAYYDSDTLESLSSSLSFTNLSLHKLSTEDIDYNVAEWHALLLHLCTAEPLISPLGTNVLVHMKARWWQPSNAVSSWTVDSLIWQNCSALNVRTTDSVLRYFLNYLSGNHRGWQKTVIMINKDRLYLRCGV